MFLLPNLLILMQFSPMNMPNNRYHPPPPELAPRTVARHPSSPTHLEILDPPLVPPGRYQTHKDLQFRWIDIYLMIHKSILQFATRNPSVRILNQRLVTGDRASQRGETHALPSCTHRNLYGEHSEIQTVGTDDVE